MMDKIDEVTNKTLEALKETWQVLGLMAEAMNFKQEM
jgi:hypothetical protein